MEYYKILPESSLNNEEILQKLDDYLELGNNFFTKKN
jgi:hypothetical protein